MAIFFTSDTHFGHKNILEYCSETRPFKSIEEHDQHVINCWNSKVSKCDSVYHLGDFALSTKEYTEHILSKLNGHIGLIRGNHDNGISGALAKKFAFVKDYHIAKIKDNEIGCTQKIVLSHYPIETWNFQYQGSWSLHGHSHGSLKTILPARLDVGVDVHNFMPLSYQDIKTILTKRMLNNNLYSKDYRYDPRNVRYGLMYNGVLLGYFKTPSGLFILSPDSQRTWLTSNRRYAELANTAEAAYESDINANYDTPFNILHNKCQVVEIAFKTKTLS